MITPFARATTHLFVGMFLFLTIATAVSLFLRSRSSRSANREGMNNLVARVLSWWAMVAIFAVALLFGREGAVSLFALIALLGVREIVRLPRGDDLAWLRGIAIAAIVTLPLVVFAIASKPRGREMLMFLVIVTEMSDVLQYCWGKQFGRTKIVPRVSPNKTWEGFIGGVLSATVLGALLRWLTSFTLLESIAMSFTIAIGGFVGGLLMSAIKRDAGVKDFGALIPGHGGVLDRVDSLTVAAPVFMLLIRATM